VVTDGQNDTEEKLNLQKFDGTGNYGSAFDGDHIHKHFCDGCLKRFLE